MTDEVDTRIWPDDSRKAAVTCAFAASVPPDLYTVIASIRHAVTDRPVEYVMALLAALTQGLGEQFNNPQMTAAYQQTAAQYQAQEDDMRLRDEWRK